MSTKGDIVAEQAFRYDASKVRENGRPAQSDDHVAVAEVLRHFDELPPMEHASMVSGFIVYCSQSPLNHRSIMIATTGGRTIGHVAFNETDGFTYINWQ